MIATALLASIADERLNDAKALLGQQRYDGAAYLSGYAIEVALKYRIATTLDWDEFPGTGNDFQEYKSFKTHNLKVLLHLSGREREIKTKFAAEWAAAVGGWNPESRYHPPSKTQAAAKSIIENAGIIVAALK